MSVSDFSVGLPHLLHLLLLVYAMGVALHIPRLILTYLRSKNLPAAEDLSVGLSVMRKKMWSTACSKTLLWPYHIFVCQSPLSFCRSWFQWYGVRVLGRPNFHGFTSFYHDIRYGKSRYKGYQFYTFILPLTRTTGMLEKAGISAKYACVSLAVGKGKILSELIYANQKDFFHYRPCIHRFELDGFNVDTSLSEVALHFHHPDITEVILEHEMCNMPPITL